jgi:hypothetical protein
MIPPITPSVILSQRLELLLHRLGLHALDAGGADESAGGHEAGELVHRVQRLRHPGLARHAHEVGVAGDGVDHLLRVAAFLQLLDRVAGMSGIQVRVPLVVEIVDQACDGVELLVLVPLPSVGTHGRLDPEQVFSERIRVDPLGDELPCIVS